MFGTTRHRFLKLGAALTAMPLLSASRSALAAKNAAMRTSLKYQDTPGPEGKQCSGCMQFVPGKTPTTLGGCKIYAGDTEISPHGYCTAWVKKP